MLIDLSVLLNEETPVYPGDMKMRLESTSEFEKNSIETHFLGMSTHLGTHIDAPSHMVLNGKNLNEIALDKFTGRGVCIKIINKNFDLNEIKKYSIQEGDIVFFNTSMSDKYLLPEYFTEFPAITEEVANYLVERKIKAVGVDACGPDYSPYLIHKILLEKNILIIENLTNLSNLIDKEFTVYAFPLKISLDGSPVRVVAEIK